MRDIMTRMIGAEIRYVRMGYRVRSAPFGYINEKVETPHGRRVILKSHPEESQWIIKMFKLRCQGTLSDEEIVGEINRMGYKSRKQYRRNPEDRTQVIGESGGKKLCIKQFWRYIKNPIFAGINSEKWTEGQVIKCKFDGLISIDTFNKANKGKLILSQEGEVVKLWSKKLPESMTQKHINNPNFPYKRAIMCPHCNKALLGSASRGKMGKHYPAYHCKKRGHYFRVSSKELEDTVESFVKNLDFTDKYINDLKKCVVNKWNERIENKIQDTSIIDTKIKELKVSSQLIVSKIKYLSSEVAIKYMEEDLIKSEEEIE